MNNSSKKAFIISLLIHVSVFAAFVQYTPIKEEKKEVIILNMNMINEVTQIKKELVQKNEVTTKEQKKQIEEKKVQKVEKKVEPVKKEIKPVKKTKPKKKIIKKEPKKNITKPKEEVKKEPVLKKLTPQKKQEESKRRVKSGENYQQKYIKTNLDSIIAAIKKYKTYPYMAKKQGYEGKVVVSCLINSKGEIKHIKVIKKCPYNVLNQNSIKILKLASKEFEPPKKDVRLTIPFNYYLH